MSRPLAANRILSILLNDGNGLRLAYHLVPIRHLTDRDRNPEARQRRLGVLDFGGEVTRVDGPIVQWLGSELNSAGDKLRLCI